jgi:hypothetical protein
VGFREAGQWHTRRIPDGLVKRIRRRRVVHERYPGVADHQEVERGILSVKEN